MLHLKHGRFYFYMVYVNAIQAKSLQILLGLMAKTLGFIKRHVTKRLDLLQIFFMYLHYPKCFQQWSNLEKSVISPKVRHFIWLLLAESWNECNLNTLYNITCCLTTTTTTYSIRTTTPMIPNYLLTYFSFNLWCCALYFFLFFRLH